MVMVSIFGGLGNQMFQYAAAKALAMKLGVELKLDITHVVDRTPRKDFTFRDFELNSFRIEDEVATLAEVRKFIPNLWNSNEIVKHFYKLKRLMTGLKLYREKQKFSYNDAFDSLSDNTYVYGYFQTEDYFKNIRPEIIKCFAVKEECLNDVNRNIIRQMEEQNSVSIHIRRGDYLNSIFENLSVEQYYQKAIDLILEKVESPVFYIFSNDYEWTVDNFKNMAIQKTIVDINSGKNSYLDMVLMSNCKHNIIANSSFSWWGAWLNQNPEKIVVSPKKWYKSGNYSETTFQLIPSEWCTI